MCAQTSVRTGSGCCWTVLGPSGGSGPPEISGLLEAPRVKWQRTRETVGMMLGTAGCGARC